MKRILIVLAFSFYSFSLLAGPSKVGNGDEGADLEGFDLVASGKLIETKKAAVNLLNRLNTSGILGLGNLIPELESSKIYLTKSDLSPKRLEELGAFHSGMEGFVYARTFPRSYAATRFFPVSIKLSDNQLIALHIHEALHRALPEKVREDESVVTKITLAIISPDQTSDSVQATIKEVIPELFLKSTAEIAINKNSKLQSPSSLKISLSKWTSSKRENSTGTTLPLDHSFNVEAQFYPFGTQNSATGFGIVSSYLFTKRNENYFGPLELTVRNLLWTQRGFDFEFKAGAHVMSASNSKVIDSVYGRDAFVIGVAANKIKDDYRLNFGADVLGGSHFSRTVNGQSTHYKVGSLININGNIMIPWHKYEFGGSANLFSLSSLRVERAGVVLLDKDRDQYFSAGPEVRYKLNNDLSVMLEGDYLFNSNKNQSEDNLKDLFGNGLGQWKWTLGIAVVFY